MTGSLAIAATSTATCSRRVLFNASTVVTALGAAPGRRR